MNPIPIFLAIAIVIIAVAFLVSWALRKSIAKDRQTQIEHERNDDGLSSGLGTGIGIDDGDS